MDYFLQMIRAWEQSHVFAPHRLRDVTAQQHHRYQSDLIDVVALLPASHFAPCDFTRHMEKTERVGGDTARIELVRRNAKVAELQPLAVTHENVEGRQVSMQRLSSMQCIEGSKDCRDLAANESLGLCAVLVEPHPEITQFGVFDHE